MKNIAVLAWWDSSEHDVSLHSAENIISTLKTIEKENNYQIFLIECSWISRKYTSENWKSFEIDKNDFSLNLDWSKIFFDFAYIIIHWNPWENGKIQWYLDMMRVPYSTWWVLNSSVGFNKHISKVILQYYWVQSPQWILLYKWDKVDESKIIDILWLPLFIKPNEWWSSFWISKVKNENELLGAIEKAFSEWNQVIIEHAVSWREFTCGVFDNWTEIIPLPITEIVTDNEFFDYEAKYLWKSKEITPAEIDEKTRKQIRDTSVLVYRKLNCKWIVRIDYIYSEWVLYFLEINLTPWMTNTSLIPQQLRAWWYSLSEIIKNQIEKQ